MKRLDRVIFDARSAPRRDADVSYVAHYFQSTLAGPPLDQVGRVGVAAVLAALADGYQSLGPLFGAVVVLWMCDVVTGTLRALADPAVSFRWSKMFDGLLRLLVIIAVSIAVAVAERTLAELAGAELDGKLLAFALGVMVVAELASITVNVSYFYPGLTELRGRLIRLIPGQPPTIQDAAVVVTERPRADPTVSVKPEQ